mgnify:CR=1 FL=1
MTRPMGKFKYKMLVEMQIANGILTVTEPIVSPVPLATDDTLYLRGNLVRVVHVFEDFDLVHVQGVGNTIEVETDDSSAI